MARLLAAPGHDSVVGSGPAKTASEVFNAGLSELSIIHNEVFSHCHLVEVRWTATGVHSGELLGFAPTGCKITLTGNDLFRIEKGQIAELWQETDLLDLFTQLKQEPCDK
jgi:predicted ester cyclase